MKYIKIIALYSSLLVIFLLQLSLPAMAKNKADITDITIERDLGNLEVSFRVQECFTPKMEEAIKTGVLTSFRIRVILEKPGIAFQSQVLENTIEHTIKYDLLKNEYDVRIPEHPERILRTRDFEEAKRWMSTVRNLPVIPLGRLEREQTYQLRLKVELSKIQLPLFLRYILFFVSLWDFETDWQQVEVTL